MKRILFILSLLVIIAGCAKREAEGYSAPHSEPEALRIKSERTVHDTVLTDYYKWMETKDERTMDYIENENAYTKALTENLDELRDTLYDEMLSRIKQTDLSVPYRMGDYLYYSKTQEGKQYSIYCRRKYPDGNEEILLDKNTMAEGKVYFSVGVFEVSPSQNLIAYAVDTLGNENYYLIIKDIKANKIEETGIDRVSSVEWADSDSVFYYTVENNARRPYIVKRHIMGRDPGHDRVLFTDNNERFWVWLSSSKDNKYIFCGSASKTTSIMGYIEKGSSADSFTFLYPKRDSIEYYIKHNNGTFYILSNRNAYNFRIDTAQIGFPQDTSCLVPESTSTTLISLEMFSDYLVISERRNGFPALRVLTIGSDEMHYIDFPDDAYSVWLESNRYFPSDSLRYSYSSYKTPFTIFDYNMKTREKKMIKQQEVIGYAPDLYETRRIDVPVRDGEIVPLTIMYLKDIDLRGDNPFVLDGYGAYGSASDPYFSSLRLSLVNRGVIIGTAHIRGGGEKGRYWYEKGKLLNKKNTFHDFIDIAEYIIDSNYTSTRNLVIRGGSAGGLLMGTVINMRPELFRGAVASVPFVDLINSMLNPELPLTVPEYEEWGDPNDKEYFRYMLSYSPYDNIRSQDYPNMLIMAGINDSRVAYWEALKWTAKLRDYNTSSSEILLRMNMGSGHGGASGRYDFYSDVAFEYAWIIDLLK